VCELQRLTAGLYVLTALPPIDLWRGNCLRVFTADDTLVLVKCSRQRPKTLNFSLNEVMRVRQNNRCVVSGRTNLSRPYAMRLSLCPVYLMGHKSATSDWLRWHYVWTSIFPTNLLTGT